MCCVVSVPVRITAAPASGVSGSIGSRCQMMTMMQRDPAEVPLSCSVLLNLLLRDEPSGVIINEANWSIRGSRCESLSIDVHRSKTARESASSEEEAASVLVTR